MQTFLPFKDFRQSALVLDYRRLGKQRVEARQIINALENGVSGWMHHPAVVMWRGFLPALKHYSNVVIAHWTERGYRNNMEWLPVDFDPDYTLPMPWWWGNEDFHKSHMSNLLRKDPTHYGPWFSHFVTPDLSYFWPEERAEEGDRITVAQANIQLGTDWYDS